MVRFLFLRVRLLMDVEAQKASVYLVPGTIIEIFSLFDGDWIGLDWIGLLLACT